jgi:hypothetical protein
MNAIDARLPKLSDSSIAGSPRRRREQSTVRASAAASTKIGRHARRLISERVQASRASILFLDGMWSFPARAFHSPVGVCVHRNS